MTTRVQAIEQYSVVEKLHVGGRDAESVRARCADLVRPCARAVGDPESKLTASVLTLKQGFVAKCRQVVRIETVRIGASDVQLDSAARGAIGRPQSEERGRILPVEEDLVADRGQVGGSDPVGPRPRYIEKRCAAIRPIGGSQVVEISEHELVAKPGQLLRIEGESQRGGAAAIKHPNLVRILDIDPAYKCQLAPKNRQVSRIETDPARTPCVFRARWNDFDSTGRRSIGRPQTNGARS